MKDLNCDYRIDFSIWVQEEATSRVGEFIGTLEKATIDGSVGVVCHTELTHILVHGRFCLTDEEFEDFTKWLEYLSPHAEEGSVITFSVLQSLQPTETSEIYFGTEEQKNECKRKRALVKAAAGIDALVKLGGEREICKLIHKLDQLNTS